MIKVRKMSTKNFEIELTRDNNILRFTQLVEGYPAEDGFYFPYDQLDEVIDLLNKSKEDFN